MAMTNPGSSAGGSNTSIWWALGIALVALLLRVLLTDFPINCHPDEPIISHLTERAVHEGTLTANWDGVQGAWWSRPTYQFSPYTLSQSAVACLFYGNAHEPCRPVDCLRLARRSSCCWGALAALLVFFLGRACFSPQAGLWGEATLATCFLHVQDSIYARVDAFLGCLVLVSLILAVAAAKRPGRYSWFVAASLVAGVTLAAKYNAIPVLALVPWIALRWAQAGSISRGRAAILALAGLIGAGIGFVVATPELLWQPGPFFAGLRYEIMHYGDGHVPYQAHGWEDNNLFYWTRYLVWLGFGWLPSLFALWFVIRSFAMRRAEDLMLATFLTISVVLTLVTKVRFERNLEICLGPLALASGVVAWELFRWMTNGRNAVVASFLGIGMLAIWFVQPVRVLFDFRETEDFPRRYRASLFEPPIEQTSASIVNLAENPSPDLTVTDHRQIILVDYGDPFSAESLERWKQFLNREPIFELRSPWSKHGYPFSTVDVYHGPPRVLGYQLPERPAPADR
jgi:hypothetical protein